MTERANDTPLGPILAVVDQYYRKEDREEDEHRPDLDIEGYYTCTRCSRSAIYFSPLTPENVSRHEYEVHDAEYLPEDWGNKERE